MALQEKMSSTGSDLDVLIHSLEYENQQYVKMIEKENQRNAYLESQEEEKLRVIADIQAQITSLEADTKNNHKQLVHNKNTLESLKKSKCVLQAHKDALLKHLDTLQHENDEQLRELGEAVQMYEKTWTDYEAQYKSLTLYQQLVEEEQRLAQSQAEHSKWQLKKSQLQTEIRRAQEEIDFRKWHRFCIKIAEKWVLIDQKKQELLDAVREKETLQSKLKEIREKNTSALVTSNDSTQDMDLDSSQAESSQKEGTDGNVTTVGDLTLVAGDGGDTGETEAEKENLGVEQQAPGGTESAVHVSSSNQTFVIRETSGTTVLAALSIPAVNPVVTEEMMEEDGGKTPEKWPEDDISRFEPSDASSPVVAGPRCGIRRPLQPLQLTSTPKLTYQRPALAVPKIGLGVHGGHNTRVQTAVPQRVILPKKVIPTSGIPKCLPAAVAASHSRPAPPQLSVPFLSIPRPPLPPSSPKIPTVRSAVSSILSSARPSLHKLPAKPPMPRIQLPRPPLLAPSPSPVLRRFPCPLEKGNTGREALQSGQGKAASSVLSVAVPVMAGEQKQGCGRETAVSGQTGNAVNLPPSEASDLPTPGAGDAPPVQQQLHGKMDIASGKHAEIDDNTTKQGPQDEEMESDSDSRGLSQPLSGSQLSEGRLSQGHSGPLSQGTLNSPFDLDKHKQKLLELNDDSGDNFNFEQRHLFHTNDKAEDQPSHSTTYTSSIFNLAFVTPSSAGSGQALGPLFKGVTSAASCPPPPSPAEPPPPVNRDGERSGSFFSFESMDTSEASAGGLGLLSMFGSGSGGNTEPQTEAAFSFAFGNSSPDSGNASAFSFSFGGEGGGKEHSSGSVFSLF